MSSAVLLEARTFSFSVHCIWMLKLERDCTSLEMICQGLCLALFLFFLSVMKAMFTSRLTPHSMHLTDLPSTLGSVLDSLTCPVAVVLCVALFPRGPRS